MADAKPIPPLTEAEKARFWSSVVKGEACWYWSRRLSRGYGSFKLYRPTGRIWLRASRVAHFLTTGESPQVVMHTCDNPKCCNPAHLRAGTQTDNVRDMLLKGRGRSSKGRRLAA